MDDPRSSKEVLSALRAVRGGMFNNKRVSVSYGNGTLRVAEGTGDGILVCPLHSVGLVRRGEVERRERWRGGGGGMKVRNCKRATHLCLGGEPR